MSRASRDPRDFLNLINFLKLIFFKLKLKLKN